jgi:hypothetical protein
MVRPAIESVGNEPSNICEGEQRQLDLIYARIGLADRL